jgi:hypothetical protein
MGELKRHYEDYLSAEDFDLMFDDEYELWLINQNKLKQKNQKLWEEQKGAKTAPQNNNH